MAHCESISIGAGSRGIGEKTDAAGHGEDKIVFTSPFSTSSNGVLPRDFGRSTHSPTSSSRGSTSRRGSSDSAPGSRRGSHDALTGRGTQAPALPTLGQPVPPHSPTTSHNPIRGEAVDFSRRRSVDVGVLGLGSHRAYGVGSLSKRVREAVGPDAGDKEAGVVGSGPEGGKDRLLGRHLASILAHSLALCANPPPKSVDLRTSVAGPPIPSVALAAIPASPRSSPNSSRSASISDATSYSSAQSTPAEPPAHISLPPSPGPSTAAFPKMSESRRNKFIASLQLWSFNAISYTPDELLKCVGLIFESLRNMEGIDFDLDRFHAFLLSLRQAYHARNSYHNFSHAVDVTQACHSFLVRMGLAPPLCLLCEDDYDLNLGEGRRKWRRNRAVEQGGMAELLRPMDVFALMVAAIGHDIGHPGLSNAYMVNAHTPVAQVYNDQSVLENFHTVTLIHLLRRHHFGYLLGGDFGRLGEQATGFRKVLEASILATDMSRHFGFVNQLTELGKSFGKQKGSQTSTLEEDRLLLCSGLIKCADISNPTRPHRISRAWSTALITEWTVQASIELEFGLPVSVMTLDARDTKAQAKSQVGFIDLFAKPLFVSMASVAEEFADFVEKLRDGRIAWEAISLQTDEAFCRPMTPEWKLSAAPPGRLRSRDSSEATSDTPVPPTSSYTHLSSPVTSPSHPTPSAASTRTRIAPYRSNSYQRHMRRTSDGSASSSTNSPLSPYFSSSVSSATGTSSLLSSHSARTDPFHRFSCAGACHAATAMCEACSMKRDPGARRGSLYGPRGAQEDDEQETLRGEFDELLAWPPYPFQPA